MPSALAVPDIVLGDRYGASAPRADHGCAENAFAAAGFSMARNSPYAGGYTTMLYGRADAGCHALQIEINRSLYLDEDSITRRPAFEALKKKPDGGADQTHRAADFLIASAAAESSASSGIVRRTILREEILGAWPGAASDAGAVGP